jgi:hypothetical protein
MVLFFACSLRLIQKLVHIVEALCAQLQPLASYNPDKHPHPNYSFGGNLVKKDLEYFQYLNHKFAQREPMACCWGLVLKYYELRTRQHRKC